MKYVKGKHAGTMRIVATNWIAGRITRALQRANPAYRIVPLSDCHKISGKFLFQENASFVHGMSVECQTEIENQKQGERLSAWFMKFSLRSIMQAFLDSRKRQTIRAPERSPTPPGQMLEKFILPRLKLTPEDVVNRTDISSAQLHLIFSGEIAISAEIAERLRPALGDYVSNLVTNHQSASDYYKKHGNWPPSPGK